jgi:spermidine/putrescine transport system permease protein
MHRYRLWNLFLLPGALWLLALFVVPLAVVVAVSLATTNIVNQPVFGWNPDNFSQMLEPYYVPLLLRTVGYAGATTVLSLLIGYPLAYTIARFGGRYKSVLVALILLPWFVDYLVRIYAWVVILGNEGVMNGILRAFGLPGDPPVQFLNTPFAVIGGLVYGYFPFMVLPVYAALEQMDPALIEAGKDLYGTPRQTFWHVTWPATLPAVAAGAILVFLPALGDFATAQLLGGANTYMAGNLISDQFQASGYPPLGAALTVALMVVLLVAIVASRRLLRGASLGVST